MLTTTQSVEEMPLDAIALCDLLARILYRCLRDQEARALLFPCVSEHPFTLLPQEESRMIQETRLVSGSSDYEPRTTGHVNDCIILAQKRATRRFGGEKCPYSMDQYQPKR